VIKFRFDDKATAAVKAAEKMAAKMVVEISKETEKNIRNLIATAIRTGISPADAARAIRPLIGLTSAQGQSVLKYREQLIESGLNREAVDKKVDRYADEKLRERADNIARTEILDALNTGQEKAWEQAQEAGLLSAEATKEVILASDPCEICQGIADEGPVPLDNDFSEEGPPFHPRCRCTIAIGTP